MKFVSTAVMIVGIFVSLGVYAQPAPVVANATVTSVKPVYEQVVVGQECKQVQVQTPAPAHSSMNVGTVLGAVAGGLLGSMVGQGNGRIVASAAGAATGAVVGNNVNQSQTSQAPTTSTANSCSPVTKEYLTGTQYTADYNGFPVSGFVKRQLQVGDQVRVEVRTSIKAVE